MILIDDHWQQHADVSRVAGPHLRANGPPRTIDDKAQNHLLQVGPIILLVAMLPQRLAALAIERQASRIHEHGREIGEPDMRRSSRNRSSFA
jgi:hypothetical protein